MMLNPTLRKVVLCQLIFPIVLLTFGIYHGLMQTLYRAGIIRSDSFLGIGYYQGLTAHGVINAIVLTTFFAVAFGHTLVTHQLKRQVNTFFALAGFWLMMLGTVLAAAMIFSGQASVLYTFYPPLKAHPLFYLGLALFVVGSWCALYSWISPYLAFRREHPNTKVPLAVIGVFATFIIWQICTIPVAVEVLFMLLPWSLGWVSTINVTLARTLFWFFGHPLVYFWLLPIYVMYYVFLPKLSGGKLFSDFAGRLAFLLFLVLSSPLGIHHQFADPGISVNWKAFHAVLTALVAVPSFMTAFTLAASMEHGARNRGGVGLFGWWCKLPYWDFNNWLFSYLFCGLLIFIFGGFTGLINASFSMNLLIHNTAWIPAHFHLTVGGPVFLGILGATLYLVSQLLGKEIVNKRLVLLTPYLWTFGVMVFSTGLFIGGLKGEPRRTNMGLSYLNPESAAFRPDWLTSSHIGVLGGILMTLSALCFFYAFFRMLLSAPKKAPAMELPISEPYHDEDVAFVKNLRPWVVAAIVAVLVAYATPLYDALTNGAPGSGRYNPASPLEEPRPS